VRTVLSSTVNDAKAAVDKLQRIRELWISLGQTKPDSPEYRAIIKKISLLSAEYQTLVDKKEPSGDVI
jgi:hypothetical protein